MKQRQWRSKIMPNQRLTFEHIHHRSECLDPSLLKRLSLPRP